MGVEGESWRVAGSGSVVTLGGTWGVVYVVIFGVLRVRVTKKVPVLVVLTNDGVTDGLLGGKRKSEWNKWRR